MWECVGSVSSSSPRSHFQSPTKIITKPRSCLLTSLFVVALMVALVLGLYGLGPLGLAQELSWSIGSEVVAEGEVSGPEDLAYDKRRRVIYTGCEDGWIKQVTVADSVADTVVNNWVNTGGRPLGLALEKSGELMVADAVKGLLRVTKKKKVEVLANEVDGLKFNLTDGVDVAENGIIYFTDATYKYSLEDYFDDIIEGVPHGRFMNYNPKTKKVTVLARNLYFPNGVVVSQDQNFVIYCETIMKRCRKYYIEGPKKGRIGEFCRNLPGMPDNIHYVGQGQYYIAMATSLTPQRRLLLKYPFMWRVLRMVTKYVGRTHAEENGGVLVVNLEGKPTARYYDSELSLISSGIKIGNYIYCGSLMYPFIVRLDVKQYPSLPLT
ncbi:hypothetical protein VNO78_34417 [Psophocarpus tetragonolobus]|uniref:Strictosidine synthase conserved region domain-containing protein n=1 Tax=Psophocarpus tetragonolobus TaxID=3891 RepID=A0AAN9RPW7_PSOTE